jgi:hypothetical protein
VTDCGHHLECPGCDPSLNDDPDRLERAIDAGAVAAIRDLLSSSPHVELTVGDPEVLLTAHRAA